MIFLRMKFHLHVTKNEYLLISAIGIVNLCLIFRQSEVLYYLNLLSILILLSLAFAQKYHGSILSISILDWLLTPFHFIGLCWKSTLYSLTIGRQSLAILSSKQKKLHSIAMGILWALPVLFLLGSLLVSSDSRFEHFAIELFSLNLSEVFSQFFYFCLYFPAISAFFYISILKYKINNQSIKEFSYTLEGIQILTILTLINLLFLSYIFIQFSYFFGGEQFISEANTLTYSSYARRGFWELICLAILVLPLLLIAHWLQRYESHSMQVWFNRLTLAMIISLLLIEASAIHRMYLYVRIYGLTELRFYSSLFMLYMMIGLVIFYFCIITNKRKQFISLISAQTIILILLLNVINPDAQISQYNFSQHKDRNIDTYYLTQLSSDAYPSIYHNRNTLSQQEACLLQSKLKRKLQHNSSKRQWNWSTYNALEIIKIWGKDCKINL
jgi:hypothetical protein